MTCSSEFLGKTLDLFTGCDFVVSVYDRFETASPGSKGASNTSHAGSSFRVTEHVSFSRDGILMSPDSALSLLLKHVLKEVQRRGLVMSTGTKSGKPKVATGDTGGSCDLEDFVAILQKSENHILAVRSLLSSWCQFQGKSKVWMRNFRHKIFFKPFSLFIRSYNRRC